MLSWVNAGSGKPMLAWSNGLPTNAGLKAIRVRGGAGRGFAVWRAFVVFRRFVGVIYRETLSQQAR
jgi:hypothetical protein